MFPILSSPIVTTMTMLLMLVTSTWHPRPQRPRFRSEDFNGSFTMPHYGLRGHWLIILIPIWWFQIFLLLTLPTTVPTCFFMTNEREARMWMRCATCGLCTIYSNKFKMMLERKQVTSKIMVVILDNCVEQNKSQLVMQFFALLSIMFYTKVVLIYLIPWHSHNSADWIIAWCCNAMKGKNFYTPMVIVEAINQVKRINMKFIDHLSALVTSVGIESWRSISINFQLDIRSTTCLSSIKASWAWDRWVQPQTVRLCMSHWSKRPIWTWLRDHF